MRDLAEAVAGIEASVKEALEEIGEGKWRKSLGSDIYPESLWDSKRKQVSLWLWNRVSLQTVLGQEKGRMVCMVPCFMKGFRRESGSDGLRQP